LSISPLLFFSLSPRYIVVLVFRRSRKIHNGFVPPFPPLPFLIITIEARRFFFPSTALFFLFSSFFAEGHSLRFRSGLNPHSHMDTGSYTVPPPFGPLFFFVGDFELWTGRSLSGFLISFAIQKRLVSPSPRVNLFFPHPVQMIDPPFFGPSRIWFL